MRHEQLVESTKVMRLWYCRAVFLQQRLEVLFRRLLAMKADQVAQRRNLRGEIACPFPVLLCLENPLPRLTLHIRLFLSPQSLAETNRLRASHVRFAWEFS